MTESFDAHTINMAHFAPQAFVYPPTGLEVVAFEVTDENIGALSIDFQADLMYDAGLPYFVLRATRVPSNDSYEVGNPVREIATYLNDWIVMLRGELHVFRDVHFRATFAGRIEHQSFTVHRDQAPTPHPRVRVNPIGPQPALETWVQPSNPEHGVRLGEPVKLAYMVNDPVRLKTTGEKGIVADISNDPDETRFMIAIEGSDEPKWHSADSLVPRDFEVEFAKGTKVTFEDHGVVKGGVVHDLRDLEGGENGAYVGSEYYVVFDGGQGGNWFHAADLRLKS